MPFPNNSLGPAKPRLCVKAHRGGGRGRGEEGGVGCACVFTQLSSGLTQVSLHKYHTHTLSPTVDVMRACVRAVALTHTAAFHTQRAAVIAGRTREM